MPSTKKQKKTACAIAHGAKLKKVNMPKKVAEEMCSKPVHKKRKKK